MPENKNPWWNLDPLTDPGSASNPGASSQPSRFLGQTLVLGAQTALPGVLTIGQSGAMLARRAASLVGGICSCEKVLSRQEAGRHGVWKDISWEPVIFTPSLRSLTPLPGRVWMCSGWTTGYLICASCGGRSAVVSAELSGVVLATKLVCTLVNTPRKRTKPAR